jgi:hypothetical protein
MRLPLMMDEFQPFAERESRNWSERQDKTLSKTCSDETACRQLLLDVRPILRLDVFPGIERLMSICVRVCDRQCTTTSDCGVCLEPICNLRSQSLSLSTDNT